MPSRSTNDLQVTDSPFGKNEKENEKSAAESGTGVDRD